MTNEDIANAAEAAAEAERQRQQAEQTNPIAEAAAEVSLEGTFQVVGSVLNGIAEVVGSLSP